MTALAGSIQETLFPVELEPLLNQTHKTKEASYSEIALNRLYSFGQWVKNASNFALDYSRKYSIVALQASLFAANTLFLVGKIHDNKELSSTAFTFIQGVGVIFFPYGIHQLIKRIKDTLFANKMNNDKLALLSSLRSLDTSASLLLIAANCAAAIAQQLEKKELMTKIFLYTVPVGEVALILNIAVHIITLLVNKKTLHNLEEIKSNDDLDTLIELLLEHDPSGAQELKNLAARIRISMDKDTLISFLKALNELEESQDPKTIEIFDVVKNNIEIQLKNVQGAKLTLSGVNYILLAVSKAYPNSVISASCNLVAQLLFTANIIIEKLREAKNREDLEEISTAAAAV